MLQAVDGEKDRLVATLLPHVLRLGKEVKFLETLKQAAKPMVIVGAGILGRADSAAVMKLVHDLVEAAGIVTEGWNGYNLLHDAAGNVGALDLGFLPSALASGAALLRARGRNGHDPDPPR